MAFAKLYTIGDSEQLQVCFDDDDEAASPTSENLPVKPALLAILNLAEDKVNCLAKVEGDWGNLTGYGLLLALSKLDHASLCMKVCITDYDEYGESQTSAIDTVDVNVKLGCIHLA